MLCGTAFHLGDLRACHHPLLFGAGFCLAYLWTAVLGHLALALPDGRLDGRAARTLAVAGYLGAVGTQVGRYVAESPQPPWWWDMTPGPNTAWAKASSLVYIGLTVAVLLVVAHRWITTTRLRRRHASAMWTAAIVAGAGGTATAATAAAGAPTGARVAILLGVLAVDLLVIPLVVLARTVQLEIAQSRAARAVLRTERGHPPGSPHGLQQALADVLGDPTLTLVYPPGTARDSAAAGAYDATGGAGPSPAAGRAPDGRAVTGVRRRGKLVALVEHDEALAAQHPLQDAAVGLAGLAIENALLYAAQQAQLEELRRSRERISAAAFEERHRIQRDLHDGAQQQLYAVLLLLDMARRTLTGVGSADPSQAGAAGVTVERAHLLLGEAISGLRDLTQGIYPTDLAEDGLAAAVARLAEAAPVPLHTDVPVRRWPRHIELTAYFLIAEALTNAYKHADASRVGLAVRAAGGGIVVEISDDGRGGAAARPGSGLSGLHDRMAAVGGTLTVISPAGRGTRLTALLPVEDLCV
ncbi:MAG TPA: hypothetical protein DEQ61_14530 [Streptomyces sp.]|nr:hypothetical protein [Streptomyces sp.]